MSERKDDAQYVSQLEKVVSSGSSPSRGDDTEIEEQGDWTKEEERKLV
jgi:hypothetical protein